MLSQVQLIGNVGKDPEMTYTPNGVAVTKFSLAVNKKRGENEETTWFNIIAWRGLAETLNEHVEKGQQLFVQGELVIRAYTTKDGRAGTSVEVIVDKFSFVGKKTSNGSNGHDTVDPLEELEKSPF